VRAVMLEVDPSLLDIIDPTARRWSRFH